LAVARRPVRGHRSRGRASPLKRAAAYLEVCDPAVSGSKGHNQLFKICCKIAEFGIEVDEAFSLIWDSYNPKCVPPWSEAEIMHKLNDAFRKIQ
jgi:hypothetical protein